MNPWNDPDIRTLLKKVYAPLGVRVRALAEAIRATGFDCSWRYYDNNCIRENGTWEPEGFPVPVISIPHLCDAGVGPGHFFIESKLTREAALAFDFALPREYSYEIYGVEEFMVDFGDKRTSPEELRRCIGESREREIGICLYLSPEQAEGLPTLAAQLQDLGFYY